MKKPAHMKSGFTLLELSIVIVIIALVAGGIVAGRSLIRNAEIREMLGEYDRYVKAIQEFQDKYHQLPGDFTRAEENWGTDPDCPAGDGGVGAVKRETCNGDGNGTIGTISDPNNATMDTSGVLEWFRAWQHMANAGVIEGLYSGAKGQNGMLHAQPGTNTPVSKLQPGTWMLTYYLLNVDQGFQWADTYGHILSFGAVNPAMDAGPIYPLLTTSEALEVDTKLDDAKPGTGKIRSWRNGFRTPNCLNETTKTASTYRTSYSGPACALIFILGF